MKYLLLSFFVLSCTCTRAQDPAAARHIMETLSSKTYWGRGYTNDGMSKAASFITGKFKSYGLEPLDGKNYRQHFTFPVNTFPGKMQVKINGRKLSPGKDFIVSPAAASVQATADLAGTDSLGYTAAEQKIIVTLKDKLTWSVAQEQADYTEIAITRRSLSGSTPQKIEAAIAAKFIPQYEAANLCAIVRGTARPDSLILFTAHYDHLGGMGSETYFPGANDNASGVALLLTIAKYYSAHPQRYSIGFICFAAEEAGLVGSRYFTEHPPIPLSNIRFLVNADMVGTGEAGITVVNATLHQKEFALLNKINDKEKYLSKINQRGKAANSDHYFFTEKGVPAFFIYTQGGIGAYHDINDRPETLPLTEYSDLFKLFVAFGKALESSR